MGYIYYSFVLKQTIKTKKNREKPKQNKTLTKQNQNKTQINKKNQKSINKSVMVYIL